MRFLLIAVFFLSLSIPPCAFAFEQVEFKAELNEPYIGSPSGVATDEAGNIYIADRNKKRLQVLGGDGKPALSITSSEIKEPSGVAVSGDRIYVADSDTDRILVFSKDGKYIDSFGEGGGDPKEFKNPMGIAVSGGIIYVADSGNSRIQLFSSDGIYMGIIGAKDELGKPLSVSVDHRGYIYVADDGERIRVFTPSKQLFASYNMEGAESVAVDKDGFYVASNSSYDVKKFDFKGKLLFSFGTEGKGRAQFRRISGMSVDPRGNLIVADSKKDTIQVFYAKRSQARGDDVAPSTSFSYVRDFKTKADSIVWGGGKLYGASKEENSIFIVEEAGGRRAFKRPDKDPWDNPGGLALDQQGNLWLADSDNDRVLKLTADGRIAFVLGSSGSKSGYFSNPTDIAISKKGVMYVSDTGNDRIQALGTDGVFLNAIEKVNFQTAFKKAMRVDLDRSDNLYVLDSKACTVYVFDQRGNLIRSIGTEGEAPGQFKYPADILVSGTELFVLDAGNQRVQAFDLGGNFLREFGAKGDGKGDFREPASLGIRDGTELFVSDPEGGRIQQFHIMYTPSAPQGLKAIAGMRQIDLLWNEGAEDYVYMYKVYRSEDGNTFEEVGTTEKTSFKNTGVLPEKTYHYRVSAVARGGNEGGKSAPVNAKAQKYIPLPPAELSSTPKERDVTLNWVSSPEDFVTSYAVYRQEEGTFKLIGKVPEPSFFDKKVRPDTAYVYKVTAISSDDVESQGVTVKVTTPKQTRPPIDIALTDMTGIFSNSYKVYEKEKPIGKIKITNNTWEEISKLKVSFVIKEFMDFPTEKEIENLQPLQSMDIDLNAIFNNKMLDITENTSVQAEIKVIYFESAEQKFYTINRPVTIYERHHLTWDIRERISIFITPKDPAVLEFSREVARQYSDINPDALFYARALFDALGVLGVAYTPDPNNPYQVTSEKIDQVDYIQYPRETLMRRSGDCDDLVNLYSSALESIGVRTNLIDLPNHILMMFSTGIGEDALESDILKDMYIIYDGQAWVPVEVTLVGSPFLDAWRKAIAVYNESKDAGLKIIDLRTAWETFKPATLPSSSWRSEGVKRADIEKRFGDELDYLKDLRMRSLSKKYLASLYENPSDISSLLQLGIVYGENGSPKAADFFRKILSLDPKNANAKNNLGNIYFMAGRYAEAKDAYLEAAVADPTDPYIFVNLTRCYLKLNMKRKAKETFQRAYLLNREIPQMYKEIAFKLEDPSLLLPDVEEEILKK